MMIETVASTALIVAREGFESVLLTGMITATLPREYRTHILINFIFTWIITLSAGWFAVELIWPYIEHIEHIMMIITATVLVYIYFNSRAIFEHAKEHADQVKDSSIWAIHLTVFLICLREALESTVFLGSNIKLEPQSVVVGLMTGVPLLVAIVYAFNNFGKGTVSKFMFRYVGFALLIIAGYYYFHGITELLEQAFGIDLF
jgi:high-affinity Fe2+/Pb2+ permease